ncbi:hypothetical protein AB0C15_16540 [Micromonospora sp. NPDC048835]|uniref:hypothetical protein n=1 Tax=Micromonospora sp. NPDC048835 TaxID=3155147 RepID=UPI0033E4874E
MGGARAGPDDTVVGWATVDNPTGEGREFVEVYVDPVRAATVRAPSLVRQLDRVAERAGERGLPSLTVRCAVFAPERDWEHSLRELRFALVERYVRMSRTGCRSARCTPRTRRSTSSRAG